MSPLSHLPTYNLKVVLRETGIKPDALRIWERRYGLPDPARSAGGHRLYSRYDIELIRWLMARQLQGSRISQAVQQWQELLSAGIDPLVVQSAQLPAALSFNKLQANTSLENLCLQWIAACAAFDELSADMLLNQAFALYSVEAVCMRVLQAALREMGERWYRGECTVQQEHFASALALRRLETLIAAAPRPLRRDTVLLACTPNEWHTFPVLLLSLLLRRQGINVVYLGANTPSLHLVETIRQVRPSLVVLAAQTVVSASVLRQMALVLQEEHHQTAYGGWIFTQDTDLCTRIPAHYLGAEIEQAAAVIQQLCLSPRLVPDSIAPQPEFLAAARAFQQKRALIESSLLHKMGSQEWEGKNMDTVNDYLGNQLLAALELGSMSSLQMDIHWIAAFLERTQSSNSFLSAYIAAYCQSVDQYLGAEGRLLTDCLRQWLVDWPNQSLA